MPSFINRHLGSILLHTAKADQARLAAAAPAAARPQASQAAPPPGAGSAVPLAQAVPLPDPLGPQAPLGQVQAATGAAFGDNVDTSGFMAWELIFRAASRSQHMQGTLRRGANAGLTASRLKEVSLTQAQISGQNRSAKLQFVGNVGVSLTAGAAGLLASSTQSAVISQLVSQGVQQVGKPALDLADRISTAGGTYRANQASLGLKGTAIDVQSGTQLVETGRAAQDQAQEELRAASQFIASYIQRKSEVSDRQASR